MSVGSLQISPPALPRLPAATPSGGGRTPRRFTVDEYHRLIRSGILTEADCVELLEGWIVLKMARNTPHDTALQKTEKAIREVLPTGWDLRGQMAITTADSEPEPDCAIVRGEADDYLAAHPTSGDIAFLVEVADSSLADDRDWKARIYGRAAIPIYWIVNVPDRQLEIFTEPTGVTDPPDAAGYRLRRIYKDTETVPVEIGGSVVAQLQVPRLLPRN